MIWVVSIGIAIVVLLFFLRPKPARYDQPADVRAQVRDAKARAEALPTEQRRELAGEVREGALENYDRNFQIAKDHGKDDHFAHQNGVLSAVKSILAPNGTSSRHAENEILTEGLPFNKADPTIGRVAVAEYLVWKFFPTEADEALFAGSLLRYRREIIEAAATEDEPDQFMMVMLYSMNFDWMRWIADNRPSE
ncbi:MULTISPECIES: hypothetical protein [Sphingomonadaceae]|uniref:hypothetical protein n=1 Tax=Blastomonas fulva TaxID=1550728 RepID=UPI004034DC60